MDLKKQITSQAASLAHSEVYEETDQQPWL